LEDYTNKYKGEQVEVALFGGEYQEGTLTAYCSIEDVPHVELNGHILIPLQNVASLHCSSRCDAPEPDWPPRGFTEEDGGEASAPLPAPRGAVALNLLKAWLFVAFLAALLAAWAGSIGGTTTALLFAFCSLLAATGVYRYGDRALLGMLEARPFALAEDPLLRSAADTSAARLGVRPPQLYLIPDGVPPALRGRAGAGELDARRVLGRRSGPAPEELEAAIAHELALVRRRDVLVRPSSCSSHRRSSRRAGSAAGSRASCCTSWRRSRLRSCTSSCRRSGSCARTSWLPARAARRHDLADALMRLDRASELVDFAASPATEPLYPVDPFESEGIARMFKTHPAARGRVRRLRELGAVDEREARVSRRARRVAARTARSRGCGRPGGAGARA
jgi:heat shock protein HtpX